MASLPSGLFLAPPLKPSLNSTVSHRQMSSSPLNPILPLCQLPPGAIGRVRELTGDASFCQRVREMGFGESTFVTKVGGRGPFICQINGTRVALSHAAAMGIVVEQIGGR